MDSRRNIEFCDILCINCQSKGESEVNLVGYHLICGSCVRDPIMKCIHCSSSVKVICDPLPLLQNSSSSPVVLSQKERETNIVDSTTLNHSTCNKCSQTQPLLKKMKFIKSLCKFCYNSRYLYFSFTSIEDFESKKQLKINSCSICRTSRNGKPCNCGLNLCFSCDQKKSCFCHSSIGLCTTCNTHQNVIQLICQHRFCKTCLNLIKNCLQCNNFQCNLCGYYCDYTTKILVSGNICNVCVNKQEKEKLKKGNVCPTCKEKANSYETKYCKHHQCIFCDNGGKCLNCRFNANEERYMPFDICKFCGLKGYGGYLFCGHFSCIDCSNYIKLKNLDYCCKICIFEMIKRCLRCFKVDTQMWRRGEIDLEKRCCRKKFCLKCFKKRSFFKNCNCHKYH